MKPLILALSVLIGGCSCCSDPVQYVQSDSTVTITDRYVPIPEILVDGVTTSLAQSDDNLGWLTFSDVFTDSATGKTIEISGVIPKDKGKIHLSARVPKDSVKVTDSSKTVTLKQVPKEKGLMERFFENVYYVASFVLAIITALIIYTVVKK